MNVFRDENVDSLEMTIPGNEGLAPVLGTSVAPQVDYRAEYLRRFEVIRRDQLQARDDDHHHRRGEPAALPRSGVVVAKC